MPLVDTISAESSEGRELYAIGDVHGCMKELLDLETKVRTQCRKRKKEPLFLMVGDLCDRGPDSKAVIDHVYRGAAAGTHKTVLGNHEFYFLQFVEYDAANVGRFFKDEWPEWLETLRESFEHHWMHKKGFVDFADYAHYSRIHWAANGGKTCIQSYGGKNASDDFSKGVPDEHVNFLLSCPVVMDTPYGSITHAFGHRQELDVLRAYQKGEASDLKLVRKAAERCLWERKAPKSPPVAQGWHFSGHTPLERVKSSRKNKWVQLDTACVYGQKLTAVNLETRKSISVASRQ